MLQNAIIHYNEAIDIATRESTTIGALTTKELMSRVLSALGLTRTPETTRSPESYLVTVDGRIDIDYRSAIGGNAEGFCVNSEPLPHESIERLV